MMLGLFRNLNLILFNVQLYHIETIICTATKLYALLSTKCERGPRYAIFPAKQKPLKLSVKNYLYVTCVVVSSVVNY